MVMSMAAGTAPIPIGAPPAIDASPTIRTPDRRVRVFVSSTLQELAAERQAARETVARLRRLGLA